MRTRGLRHRMHRRGRRHRHAGADIKPTHSFPCRCTSLPLCHPLHSTCILPSLAYHIPQSPYSTVIPCISPSPASSSCAFRFKSACCCTIMPPHCTLLCHAISNCILLCHLPLYPSVSSPTAPLCHLPLHLLPPMPPCTLPSTLPHPPAPFCVSYSLPVHCGISQRHPANGSFVHTYCVRLYCALRPHALGRVSTRAGVEPYTRRSGRVYTR